MFSNAPQFFKNRCWKKGNKKVFYNFNTMNKRIVIDPKIMRGKPVIRRTRIPVLCYLKSLLADGYDYKKIMKEYLDLKKEDILAAVKFAAKAMEFRELELVNIR
jgi:uncharacterized protein (DUF433 family)